MNPIGIAIYGCEYDEAALDVLEGEEGAFYLDCSNAKKCKKQY